MTKIHHCTQLVPCVKITTSVRTLLHFQLKHFFVVVVLDIIDMSLNHVPLHENEETTENGIHPDLAKVILCNSAMLLPRHMASVHPLYEKGNGP